MIGKGSLVQIAIQVRPTRYILGGLATKLGFKATGIGYNLRYRDRTSVEIATVTLTKDYTNINQLRDAVAQAVAQAGWTLGYYPEITVIRLVAGSQAY